MGRIIVSEFVTLDGVIEAPGHEDHRDGKNAWALRGTSEDQQRFKVDEIFAADAILLGRVTYQIFALFWPTAPEDFGFADRMNGLEKYVVPKTLRDAAWENTTFLRGDVAEEVASLKERIGGDIMVFGSGDLVDGLMQHDLVDEFRILVYPVVLGSGKRLFRDGRDTSDLRLVGTRAFSSGTVLLSYQPAGESPSSEYVETFAWTEEQIKSWHAAQDTDRVLASVLFTDIVDSTGRGPQPSAIRRGAASWIVTTGVRGRRSSASAVASSKPWATASSRRSTRRPGRSGARSDSPTWRVTSGSTSAQRSIPARSRSSRMTFAGSASTSRRGCSPRRVTAGSS